MNTTEKLGLKMPESTDAGAISALNYNAGILDTEVSSRIKTINGESANPDTGNYNISEVPYARQLVTEDKQTISGNVLCRATGGGTSITNGDAEIISIHGRMLHTGYQEEGISLSVQAVERETPITATYDRDTFVAYAQTSGTYTFTYTSGAWDPVLTNTGITVSGTPVNGDIIRVIYVKGELGTITMSKPTALRSTGWNLYDNDAGYARVVKYSDTYGFKIGGTYESIMFSTDSTGTNPSNLYPDANGLFDIPSNGYVIVSGGNATDTYILMTWSDWADGPAGGWEAYDDVTISLANAMTYFPNGLMQVGDVADEINFRSGKAYRRIGRLQNTAANMSTVEGYDVDFIYDGNYIYYVYPDQPNPDTINVQGTYTANDHGMEIIDGNDIEVYAVIEYNQNLVSKLRTDVVTISSQDLTASQKTQVRTNINAASKDDVAVLDSPFLIRQYTMQTPAKISGSGAAAYTTTQFHVEPIEGYSIFAIQNYVSSSSPLVPYATYRTAVANETIIKIRNIATSDNAAGKTLSFEIVWIKNGLLGV